MLVRLVLSTGVSPDDLPPELTELVAEFAADLGLDSSATFEDASSLLEEAFASANQRLVVAVEGALREELIAATTMRFRRERIDRFAATPSLVLPLQSARPAPPGTVRSGPLARFQMPSSSALDASGASTGAAGKNLEKETS